MVVCFNESRHHAAITGIDDLGAGPDPALDVGALTDRDDPAIGHGQRLGGRLEFVNSEDSSLNDQVSGQHEAILPALEILWRNFAACVDFGGLAFDVLARGTRAIRMDGPLPN